MCQYFGTNGAAVKGMMPRTPPVRYGVSISGRVIRRQGTAKGGDGMQPRADGPGRHEGPVLLVYGDGDMIRPEHIVEESPRDSSQSHALRDLHGAGAHDHGAAVPERRAWSTGVDR